MLTAKLTEIVVDRLVAMGFERAQVVEGLCAARAAAATSSSSGPAVQPTRVLRAAVFIPGSNMWRCCEKEQPPSGIQCSKCNIRFPDAPTGEDAAPLN